MTTVWLIRHAAIDGANGRCYGRQDLRLSDEGIRQAGCLAKRFAGEQLSHIYSSCMKRAIDTARILAEPHGLPVQTIEALGEIDFGDLEGLTYEEIQQAYPDVFESWMTHPTETEFPNGESFGRMSARVLGVLGVLLDRHRNESVVVVTHAGVIRVVLGKALSMPDNLIFRLAQDFAAVNRIKYFDGSPIVELING